MHELGIAKDLWAIIVQKAKENNISKITKITIMIGETSGIEADFLKHSLVDHIMPGSIAGDATLELLDEKIAAKCKKCGREITKDTIMTIKCPFCGSMQIDITAGKETYVKSIEGQ
ncbi:MAG TPA: hypothetical protein DEE98_03120 [Elusimicrobia bacterium]|nr:MAG: hypothetical protein A2278_07940 [Elusimicrobia bacterium RIFOXYA12_FULL_49_49]OGS10185.1 MAG: hypothetical protein A2204_04260 [Elusimicrobia bacterium RIFOXYA1_FULL_47_7]OGS11806.1 MAG: hypothetical protein A2386_02210 [Elusimicrobia bacterium RIFOXYB1_FULL_48_9]OGS16006.1 MAG: hypothetical protein A2251_02325 [Elusimicrobia bacterium RIFOXYA2_FULL_47_53]OGS26314.1 MAG: hypothetical protein A2339_02940 [Elusimicrobia bacterium RIFOXYB12_FULL_50_12]OGS29174.1 MAG: hypothetical protein